MGVLLERKTQVIFVTASSVEQNGKARWAKLTPEERSAQARKIVGARWAKKKAAVVVSTATSSAKPSKPSAKRSPKSK